MLKSVDLETKLKDPSLLKKQAYINGKWVGAKSGKTFPVYNPSTGEVIVDVPDMGVEDLQVAIDGAYKAQKLWAAKTGKDRAGILKKWNDLMVENADDLAIILTAGCSKEVVP